MKPCIMDYLNRILFPRNHKPCADVSTEEVERARKAWREEFHKHNNIKQVSVKKERDEKKANDEAINAARDAIKLFEKTKNRGIFK